MLSQMLFGFKCSSAEFGDMWPTESQDGTAVMCGKVTSQHHTCSENSACLQCSNVQLSFIL